ncbi:aminotransferase class V-fold PLP-dependent enzyme [Hymenobacter sp. 15J16-1T3B]|uniref:aminotransferase class V-fold PLP-dependent enzyme n=1 Tax=Hymenobacter sp. 15J16-1T3B TaxID=2886941 RepID=UPI001D105B3E|nr:aminotransferase class V-fold PLP-dependent enzyme [Hymenobacter sp. 15J16-1T3B]MCC3157667.1 aminotransferase class V-fold PLP-dependent enzyme [Hymenobacter sp. 15J16-1T3B]
MNVDLLRQQTPGCADKLFLNSAGASLMPRPVVAAMTEYLLQEEQLGGYEVERRHAAGLQQLYAELAQLLNAQPRNFAFAWNATDAYSRALAAIPFRAGDVILTTDDDYISNHIAFLALQKRFGIRVVRARTQPSGDLDLDDFARLLREHRPVLVAVTHVPTNSGLVQPVAAVGALCRQHDTWYLVDASQSVGQLEVDVQAIGCDFLNAPGRKFLRGPRGTGFLYVSDRALQAGLEPLFIDRRGAAWTGADAYAVHPDARRFEQQELGGTVLGLMEAVRYANAVGVRAIAERNAQLTAHLRQRLAQLPHLRLLDQGSEQCSLVTFDAPGRAQAELTDWLTAHRVFFTVSLKSFALLDFSRKQVEWAIRLSPHYFNTVEELDRVVELLAALPA